MGVKQRLHVGYVYINSLSYQFEEFEHTGKSVLHEDLKWHMITWKGVLVTNISCGIS